MEQDLTAAYETETCSRCGGSGQYSYCQSHGTTCFKCMGKRVVYSKRGQAAIEYGRSLRTVKASQVQVGWLLYQQAGPLGGKTGWFPVTESELSDQRWTSQNGETGLYWHLETEQGGCYTFPESDEQAVPSRDRLREIKALAIAYQTTLTKAGKSAKERRNAPPPDATQSPVCATCGIAEALS